MPVCVPVYRQPDAPANIYPWKSAVGMCLGWGNGSPIKVFVAAPALLIMIMSAVLSGESEQTSVVQASPRSEDRVAPGSGGRGLNGEDLLWREPKLLAS